MNRSANLRTRAGFTFVEMLVVIALTTLVMFLVYRLFFDSLQVISRGVALSEIHISARTFGETLDDDAKGMMPPASPTGGVLVIFQKEIAAKRFPEDPATSPIRSDQLMFIRDSNVAGSSTIRPMVPSSTSTLVPLDSSLTTRYSRIWYGHAQRTNQNGTDDGVLGAAGANEFAGKWVLARQALFLGVTPGSSPYSSTAIPTAGMANYASGTNGYPAEVAAQTGSLNLYHGLTDLTTQALGSSSAGGTMLEDLEPDTVLGVPIAPYYATNAYKYMYGTQRLRVNPTPVYDVSTANFGNAYASWQVAQMHPLFLANVSDFAVDFAGDYDAIPGIDKDLSGNIKWYSYFFNNPLEGRRGNAVVGGQDDSKAYTYSAGALSSIFNIGILGGNAPIYDTSTTYAAANPPANADAAIVFQHEDTSDWPHLLRIRARVHDANGNFVSTNDNIGAGDASTPGVYYEAIVTVNR